MGITATEAAKQIGCSVSTVSRWADALELRCKKYGSSFILSQRDVNKIKGMWKQKAGRPKVSD